MIDTSSIHAEAARRGPVAVAALLGFSVGSRSHRGACPIHGGKNPQSFALDTKGGTLVASCHSCGFGGDVIGLVGALHGLTSFPEMAEKAAEVLGIGLEQATTEAAQPTHAAEREAYTATQAYPDAQEVCGLWNRCPAGEYSRESVQYLEGRGFELQMLRELDIVRELPLGDLPAWARIRGRSWTDAGYRLVVRTFDGIGCVRSLRAWRTVPCDDGLPKRLAPAGKRASGLVLANARGELLLSCPGYFERPVVRICEGEPSLIALAHAFPSEPVLGATSATGWADNVGDRLPSGSLVIVYPDADAAGSKLTDAIVANVGSRCNVVTAVMEAA